MKKSYTEWRVNGDAAYRDCHAEIFTSFQRLKRQYGETEVSGLTDEISIEEVIAATRHCKYGNAASPETGSPLPSGLLCLDSR